MDHTGVFITHLLCAISKKWADLLYIFVVWWHISIEENKFGLKMSMVWIYHSIGVNKFASSDSVFFAREKVTKITKTNHCSCSGAENNHFLFLIFYAFYFSPFPRFFVIFSFVRCLWNCFVIIPKNLGRLLNVLQNYITYRTIKLSRVTT